MGIAQFFDKTVVVRRLKSISGTDKQRYEATATADGAIQEMDRTARVKQGLLDERAWIAYFDIEAVIAEGDTITRQDDGKLFKVLEVTKKDYGINQHLEVIIVEYNA